MTWKKNTENSWNDGELDETVDIDKETVDSGETADIHFSNWGNVSGKTWSTRDKSVINWNV